MGASEDIRRGMAAAAAESGEDVCSGGTRGATRHSSTSRCPVDSAASGAETLARLRGAMQGAEVPAVLLRWMNEVEEQLIVLRGDVDRVGAVAKRAETDSFGLRRLG